MQRVEVSWFPDGAPDLVPSDEKREAERLAATRPVARIGLASPEARWACPALRAASALNVWALQARYGFPQVPQCGACGLPTGSFCDGCGYAFCTMCGEVAADCPRCDPVGWRGRGFRA